MVGRQISGLAKIAGRNKGRRPGVSDLSFGHPISDVGIAVKSGLVKSESSLILLVLKNHCLGTLVSNAS